MQRYSLIPLLFMPHANFFRSQSNVMSLLSQHSPSLNLLHHGSPWFVLAHLAPRPSSPHSHFRRTANAELKVNWAWWVPRWASSREPASGPWPAASSSAAAFSTSQPPSCWWDSMWELSRGYRAEETQPTSSPASRSKERSSASHESAVSWWKKERRCKYSIRVAIESGETNFSLLTYCILFSLVNTYQEQQSDL